VLIGENDTVNYKGGEEAKLVEFQAGPIGRKYVQRGRIERF